MSNMRTLTKTAAALFTAATLITSAAVAQDMAAQDMKAHFGGSDDRAFASALWSALESANHVGDGAMPSALRVGQPPHGAVIETVETPVSVKGRSAHAIIKNNFGPMGVSVASVASNPGKHLNAITVMFKREAGYDADNNDWFWAKYNPDGTLAKNPMGMALAGRVAKGMDQGCIACHSAAAEGDYIFGPMSDE